MLFDLSLIEIAGRLLIGGGIGFCIGLTGVGGGVLMLPALTLLFGMDPVAAVGTASLYSFLTKVSATWHHFKLKTVEWKIAWRFLIGAVPANIGIALWISSHGSDEEFNQGLKAFIAGVVCFSVLIMLVNSLIKRTGPALRFGEHTLAHYLANHPALLHGLNIAIGAIVGSLIGATSIGGGVLIIPALIIVFGLSASRTVGTSIFISIALNLITASIYGGSKAVDIPTVVVMALGSLATVYYGSKLAVRLPDRLLKFMVFGLMFVTALLMVADAMR
ncbi:MAG: sulfite exporter TauE/SafE family protein [Verrucomicrobiota bacterium]